MDLFAKGLEIDAFWGELCRLIMVDYGPLCLFGYKQIQISQILVNIGDLLVQRKKWCFTTLCQGDWAHLSQGDDQTLFLCLSVWNQTQMTSGHNNMPAI